jgi:diaminohydroxyphosphoribosylaminopyrimidine deaminase / 5-amino-6-(5-phosphoribosylamino)uracil reductase
MSAAAERQPHEADDVRFMELALVVGNEADGPVIIGRGWTQSGGRPHAETEALARAGAAARGATLYVTLEPCSHYGRTPPCADAVIDAGIGTVISALEDPNPQVAGAGHRRMAAAGITVRIGTRAEEARRSHAGHIRRIRDGRPHVMLKLAVSADGKAGLAGRRPVAITGEAARARVHRLRAVHDAVLTGIGTVLADDPLLTCRLPGMAQRSPVRVVLDTQLRLAAAARLVTSASEVPLWVLTSEQAANERELALQARGVEVIRVPLANGALDLKAALETLAGRGITRLMVEGGPILAAALLRADLIDEAALLRSGNTIGPGGIDALEGLPLEWLTRSPKLAEIGAERLGEDMMTFFARR